MEKGGEVLSTLFFAKTIYMFAVKTHFTGGKPAFKFPNIAIRPTGESDRFKLRCEGKRSKSGTGASV